MSSPVHYETPSATHELHAVKRITDLLHRRWTVRLATILLGAGLTCVAASAFAATDTTNAFSDQPVVFQDDRMD